MIKLKGTMVKRRAQKTKKERTQIKRLKKNKEQKLNKKVKRILRLSSILDNNSQLNVSFINH